MSDAILTFQVQLSGVMETVLKSAMYEITRLVEDSFLEEVSRSREQVESLRQRLQWSESRRREREGGGGRSRCADCGRAAVSSEDAEDRASGPQSGVDEGRGLKQEKVPEGSWSSCPGEVATSNPGPARSAPEDLAPPSPVRASENSAAATDVDGDGLDAMLKEEALQAAPTPDQLQERWGVCLEGPDAGFGDERLQLCEEEWGPGAEPYGARYGTEEELGAALEAESKVEYMAAMLGGAGELEDSLLRPVGQLSFPPGLDPVPVQLNPQGRTSPRAELDCLLINEDGCLQGADGRYRGPRRGRESRRGERPLLSPDGTEDHRSFGLPSNPSNPSAQQQRHRQPGAGPAAYTCTQCGKGFTQACNLKVHQRVHSGEGLHLCSHCGQGYVSFAELKRHECSHAGEKPYCCALCGNRFSRLWNLKLHRRIHTQEKPHRCAQCGKSFTRADILKVHQRTHTGERPYRCAVCGLSFKRLDHLKSHQRKHS